MLVLMVSLRAQSCDMMLVLAVSLRAHVALTSSMIRAAATPPKVTDWYSGQLIEAEKDYCLMLPLPGMRSNDMTVTFNDGMVIIEGETKTERQFFKTSHQLRLPSDGDSAAACTFPADGVMTIELPKVKPDKWTV